MTGHGLGGSFAQLAAIDINQLYQNTDAVYTFGSCRVGNKAYSQYYTNTVPETYRIIHYADVVPHLPIAAANYVHSGWEIWYQSDMTKYKQCVAESPDCANSLPNSALSVSDNNIQNYMNLTPQIVNMQRE